MDEQVIQDLFNRAVSKGYSKTLQEFKVLLNTDNEVIQDNFQYVTSQGYNKSLEDFKVLIGSEKKKDTTQEQPETEQIETEDATTFEEVVPQDYWNDPQELNAKKIIDNFKKTKQPKEFSEDRQFQRAVGVGTGLGPYTPIDKKQQEFVKETGEYIYDMMDVQNVQSDPNIQKAIQSNLITDKDVEDAFKLGDNQLLDKINSLTRRTPKEIDDKIKELRLDETYTYEKNSSLDDDLNQTTMNVKELDINTMYDIDALKKIEGLNIKDFDGYLSEQGYKEQFKKYLEDETISLEGREFDYSGNYNPALAAERVLFNYLNNYLNDQTERNVNFQKLKYQKENEGSMPMLDGVQLSYSSNVDPKGLQEYIFEKFPRYVNKLKAQDAKNQELWQERKNEKIWSWDVSGDAFADAVTQGARSLEDRIATFSEGVYDFIGLESMADEIRMSSAETKLNRKDLMRYVFAEGKEVEVDGVNYLVDGDGQVYSTTHKLRVTHVLNPMEYKTITQKAKAEGKESSSFSGLGLGVETTGVMTDMVFQLAIQRGAGTALKGSQAFMTGLGGTAEKTASLFSKIPMNQNMSSVIIGQGTLFSTNMYSETRQAALEKGLSTEKANEVSAMAAKQGYVLGALTAPLSPQSYAMNKLFGEGASKKISKELLDSYIKGGQKGFQQTAQKILSKAWFYNKQGLAEVFQENVQQGGKAFVIAPGINEVAGKEIMKNTISLQEFKTTSLLSYAAGTLMPFAGDVMSAGKKGSVLDGSDKLQMLAILSEDVDKTTQLLNSQVAQGLYTEDQVNNLLNDISVYRNSINSIPSDLSPQTGLETMQDLNDIKRLEEKKNKLDKAFHAEIDNEIEAIRENIRKKVDADKQPQVTEEVSVTREETVEALEKEGVTEPTEEQIIKKQDEIATEKVAEITPEEKVEEEAVVEEPTLVAEQEQVREEIVLPYKPKKANVDVNIVDGKVQSINKKNTKQPASRSQKSIAEKDVLTNVIDVNAGKKVEIPADATPQDIPGLIFTDSENVREIAEAIDTEKKRLKESKTKGRDVSGGIYDILNIKFTPESWKRVTGLSSAESKVQFWMSKDGVSIEDGWQEQIGAEAAAQLSTDQIVDFIETYNTAAKVAEFKQGDPEIATAIRDLETKFKDLTGVSPTPTNIKTVINIDPNRPPLKLIEEQVAEQEAMQIAEGEIETFGKKKAPSAKRLLGIKKKIVTVDEAAALKETLRKEAKAAREAKADVKKKRNDLINKVREIEGRGVISTKQTKAIINVLGKVNVDNPSAVNKALDYADKVIQNADNIQKLKDAESIRSKIKKLSKRKTVEARVSKAAEEFTQINPRQVSDLDVYLENANEVLQGVSPSKAVKDGVKIAPTFDIKKINDYNTKALEEENIQNKERNEQLFEEVTGLDPKDFTFEEMQELLYNSELTQEARDKRIETKEKLIRDGVKKANDTYSAIVDSILKTGIDPFTGEKVELSSKEKQLVKDFLNVDLNNLTTKDALIYIDQLINFATNQSTGGMGKVIERQKGQDNAKNFNKPNNRGKKFGDVTSLYNTIFASAPNAFDYMFKSQRVARDFMKESGFTEIVNGAAKAETQTKKITDNYISKFTKTKPNNKPFMDIENVTERQIISWASRSTQKNPEQEFKRRKDLWLESISNLSKGNAIEKKKSDIMQKAYDKILKDSNTTEEVQEKADKTNVQAVNWWIDEFSKIYPELSEVSLNFYNSVLGEDINYTPDIYSKVSKAKEIDAETIDQPSIDYSTTRVYDKKSGTLIEPTRPTALPKDRVVSMSFDSNMASAYQNALTDIYTAPSIQKAIGFTNSSAFKNVGDNNIFPDVSGRDMAYERIKGFVQRKRMSYQMLSESGKKTMRLLNKISTVSTGRVLAGVFQGPKQLTPWVNSFILAGPVNMTQATADIYKDDVRKLINESGRPIANRGVESQTALTFSNKLDADEITQNKLLEVSSKGLDVISKANRELLQYTLVNFDKWAARTSFWAFYLKDLKKQGIDTSKIDWATHKLNDRAADYAQNQVDRQQNVSDKDLQGTLYGSKRPEIDAARKIVFPFANFIIQKKVTMFNDLRTFTSKTTSNQDKADAAKSLLVAIPVELVTFHAMGYGIGLIINLLTRALGSFEEDDEQEKERYDKLWKSKKSALIKDFVSPLPLLDPVVGEIYNYVSSRIGSESRLYTDFPKDFLDKLGVLGIGIKNFQKVQQRIEEGITGKKYTEMYGKSSVKELTPEQRDAQILNGMITLLYAIGGTPAEVGILLNQYERYNLKTQKEEKKRTRGGRSKGRASSRQR
jgi:hypothetical protein